jgi:hypothetical protein
MERTGKDIEPDVDAWRSDPGWDSLCRLVADVVSPLAGSHPGIVTEAIVDAIVRDYTLLPRETWHRERRRNHGERIRRLSHAIFRIIEDAGREFPVELITSSVLKAFIVGPRPGQTDAPGTA